MFLYMPKKYHITTFGCQQNRSDSERVASVFNKIGFEAADSEANADVVVVNACAIRQTAMDRVYGKLRHWRPRQEAGELVTILTGCVLEHDRKKLVKEFDHFVKIDEIANLPELLGEGNKLDLEDYFAVEPDHESDFKASIPIMTGCDKFCTYCAVPYTRGREVSRPVNDILKEAKDLIAKGYKEITLLGQNVNSYVGKLNQKQEKRGLLTLNASKDKVIDFPDLIKLVADIEGDFWLRFVTSHPYDMSDKLIETIASNDKIVNNINFPIQSGDDEILKKMNRHYTVEHYKERLAKIRELCQPCSVSTDIIVGFCGETEEQFQKTAQLIRDLKFDLVYINKYSPRPGAVSAEKYEDDVPWKEKKRRDKYLNDILDETGLNNNAKFIGQTVRVLVDDFKKDEKGLYKNIGKSDLNKTVQFFSARSYVGQFVDVSIVEVAAYAMSGELV